ncbi:IkappaB kinase complex IKAP component [Lactarius deliciosus]|nr:IkappaB kinase complex IKAP component [Lactarius deliciosus]
MKNLSLSAIWRSVIPDVNITTVAVDVDNACLWIASERLNADADTEIDVYKRALPSGSDESQDSFSQVTSLKSIPGEELLVIVTRGGDIAIDEFEIIGSFEDGIQAAAWSPDDSLLILVTGEGKLIVMTPTFDVLHESVLHTDEFGEDAPINVGWGSKQTQFHGSLGKTAAQASAAPSSSVGVSPDDDLLTRISWRGDGSATTAEAVPGLEHSLSWRPSGNLIVSTQRFGTFPGGGKGREGRHDVVHGEFGLRHETPGAGKADVKDRKWGYKVKEVCWSADSNVLLVWIEDAIDIGESYYFQLWTTGNYHWYLKQEIAAPPTSEGGRFTSVTWHPENALQILLTTKTDIISHSYRWETCAATARAPNDTGTVAVVDGSSVLLTPFRMQNVPPPMSSHRLTFRPSPSAPQGTMSTPSHLSFSSSEDILAVIWETGYVELWNLCTPLEFGRGPVMTPELVWSGALHGARFREICAWTNIPGGATARIAAVGAENGGTDVLQVLDIRQESTDTLKTPPLESLGWRLAITEGAVVVHRNGKVYEYDSDSSQFNLRVEFGLPCDVVRVIDIPRPSSSLATTSLFLGLTRSGTLFSAAPSSPRTLAQNANSFTISGDLVVYTTLSHEAHFIPAPLLATTDANTGVESERRRVERGSRIVTSVPSAMSLVLQMPRGNLETINPRPMVMAAIQADVDAGNYRKAFLACRKHRIDLNVIVDRDPKLFRERLPFFVEQVGDVDYINLFLTNLAQGSQPAEVISELCDSVRKELESRDMEKYINSILTAYVVKRPPDLEAGLRVLLQLRERVPSAVEDAVKYIIFLVDADTLFDVALGMYDFSLVLLVAQHAQKDPREYLPFLRELRALEKYYQRFRIDDHLKRYKSALRNLSLAGPERFSEVKAYVEKHQLYEIALEIFGESDQLRDILDIYGDWLFERREFGQSALVFLDAEQPQKVLAAYEKAHSWRELFEFAQLQKIEPEDIVAMAYRVAEDLTSKKRYTEASQVLLCYAEDVREAVIALVQGNQFSEARRILCMGLPELLEEIIDPAVLEARAQITEDLIEMREQLQKQVARLRELRIKKLEEPEEFYGTEDLAVHNVDVMTGRRKMERKVGSGRKGTVDEEEYLLKCAAALVPHLLRFTPVHRTAARELQNEVAALSREIAEAFDEADTETAAEPAADSWAARMAEREKERERAVKAIAKPELRAPDVTGLRYI